MDNKTVFALTLKGEGEIKNLTHQLPEEAKRILLLVDDEANVEVLARRTAPSLRAGVRDILLELERGGFIQDKADAGAGGILRISIPQKSKTENAEDLDFTSSIRAPDPANEAKEQAEADAARTKVAQMAATIRMQFEAEHAKAEAEAKAQAEAGAKAKQEAEMARIESEREAARMRAEAEAMRIDAEQESARIKAELEVARREAEQAWAELEAAKRAAETLAKKEAAAVAQARFEAEAEALRIKAVHDAAEVDAARRKIEDEIAKAKAEAEALRLKAEQEAAKVKEELEAVRAKAEAETLARAEAQARAEAEAKAKLAAEEARLKAEQDAAKARAEAKAKVRVEAEAARLKAEQEIARVKAEAEEQIRRATQAKNDADSALAAKVRAEASAARSMIATVLFFDVVGYTKQSVSKQIELKTQFNKLVSEFIKDINESQRIILDTGDGAAIGFLQHPEDAIEVALKFRQAVSANQHRDYPDLKVRIGIHLGPVNIVKDMNGQSNMVGDGINDAQRIMSFAPSGHIYISRSYFDVVSRLSAEYAGLFLYRGIKNDKHGRQHQVYEASNDQHDSAPPIELVAQVAKQQEPTPFTIQLDPFLLNGLGQVATPAAKPLPGEQSRSLDKSRDDIIPPASPVGGGINRLDRADEREGALLREFHVSTAAHEIVAETAQAAAIKKKVPSEVPQTSVEQTQSDSDASEPKPDEQKTRPAVEIPLTFAEQEAVRAKAERDARLMADEQAQAWAAAAQRAKALESAKAEEPVTPPIKTISAGVAQPRARRKPLPLSKIVATLFFLLLALAVAFPYVWPMQRYAARLEQRISSQLGQPVHIARLTASLLPLPKLELQNVSVGGAEELKAARVVLNFDVLKLFGPLKNIKTVEISELDLNAGSFGQALAWLQAAGGDAQFPTAHMVLRHGQISGLDTGLSPLSGDADWDAQGHFSKAQLSSEDGKLDIGLQAQPPRWQVVLRIRDSHLPWLPDILFNDLSAKGEADMNNVDFTEIDGHFYRGKLVGNAHLNWQKGWQMKGHLNAVEVELEQALPGYGISGEMQGESSFMLNSATLPQLFNAPNLEGAFKVRNGVLSKMDMVETARLSNLQSMAGGRTHFEELTGTLQIENNTRHLRQIRLVSGKMSAAGTVDIGPDGRLGGRLNVDIVMRAGSVPLALSGTLAEPVLRPEN